MELRQTVHIAKQQIDGDEAVMLVWRFVGRVTAGRLEVADVLSQGWSTGQSGSPWCQRSPSLRRVGRPMIRRAWEVHLYIGQTDARESVVLVAAKSVELLSFYQQMHLIYTVTCRTYTAHASRIRLSCSIQLRHRCSRLCCCCSRGAWYEKRPIYLQLLAKKLRWDLLNSKSRLLPLDTP
jgi:hypothetical protein